jgi:hypothetical protein
MSAAIAGSVFELLSMFAMIRFIDCATLLTCITSQGDNQRRKIQMVCRAWSHTHDVRANWPPAPDSSQKEIFSSWALFILIMLLITALFTSYMLQNKKVEAVHETVISIFAGEL